MKRLRLLYEKFKNDRGGEITLETMLVMIPTLFVLVFLLGLGFLLYQHWDVQIVADDVANKIAGTYSMLNADDSTGEITEDQYDDISLYRYKSGTESTYRLENKNRVKDYLTERLRVTSYSSSISEPAIEYEVGANDSFARRHMEITVTATYRVPFSEGLELMGIDGERTYSGTSAAECLDMLDFVNATTFADEISNYVNGGSMSHLNSWSNMMNGCRQWGR